MAPTGYLSEESHISENQKIVFSPDNNQFAYIKEDEAGKYSVVYDGIESETYDYIDNVSFSPDGNHLVFLSALHDKQYVVIDNNVVQATGDVLFFGNAKVVFDTNNKLRYLVQENNTLFLIEHLIDN